MQLTEFLNKTMTSANEAKNFMSFLIGYGFYGPDSAGAILGVYDSLPAEYKKDKKVFSQVFLKFFTKFQLCEKSHPYYEQFKDTWSSSQQEIVKNFNPNWNWTGNETQFKNSLEFAKAFSKLFQPYYQNKNRDNMYAFLEENKHTIVKLIEKDKNKLQENLYKYRCWEYMVEEDYMKFKQLCSQYGFDAQQILKRCYVEHMYGCGMLVNKVDDTNFKNILQDMHEANLFRGSDFFASTPQRNSKSYFNVLHLALKCLSKNFHASFSHLYNTYPQELKNCMNHYLNSDSQPDNPAHWQQVHDELYEKLKSSYHGEPFHLSEAIVRHGKLNNVELIGSIILQNKLHNNLPASMEAHSKKKPKL